MRVQNVDHNENRELRRDCAAVFQMLFDRKQQDFIAEGIVIAGAAGSKENGRGSLFLCGSERTQHLRCLSADGNADCSAALIEQNGTLDSIDEWGKRKLAYAINDEPEGFYALFNFSAVPEFPEEFYRVAGITDGVLRSLIVRK